MNYTRFECHGIIVGTKHVGDKRHRQRQRQRQRHTTVHCCPQLLCQTNTKKERKAKKRKRRYTSNGRGAEALRARKRVKTGVRLMDDNSARTGDVDPDDTMYRLTMGSSASNAENDSRMGAEPSEGGLRPIASTASCFSIESDTMDGGMPASRSMSRNAESGSDAESTAPALGAAVAAAGDVAAVSSSAGLGHRRDDGCSGGELRTSVSKSARVTNDRRPRPAAGPGTGAGAGLVDIL